MQTLLKFLDAANIVGWSSRGAAIEKSLGGSKLEENRRRGTTRSQERSTSADSLCANIFRFSTILTYT